MKALSLISLAGPGLACFVIGFLWLCHSVLMAGHCDYERDRAAKAEALVEKLQARIDADVKIKEKSEKEAKKLVADLRFNMSELKRKKDNFEVDERSQKQELKDKVRGLIDQKIVLEKDNEKLKKELNTAPSTTKAPWLRGGGRAFGNGVLVGSNMAKLTDETLRSAANEGAIGIAVITCKRPVYLQRAMSSFLETRGDSPEQMRKYPIIISQDGYDEKMTTLIQEKYVRTGLAYHMHHQHDPDGMAVASRFGGRRALGYVRIAQHYGFVMDNVFDVFKFKQAIFLEEDMEISPDFFSYFSSMLPILQNDPKLYCVSAWNDNGYAELVSDERAVYRTDFFPGLGWMMERKTWHRISERWPSAYWDEFMRRPDIRDQRQCIRPEISRSFTFGEEGVSSGQFFKSHLSRIKLNTKSVDWASEDLSYLKSDTAFDEKLLEWLREATPVSVDEIDRHNSANLRILYDDKTNYKKIAKRFGLMPDAKEGVRRMSYRGVIPFSWRGNRIYLYTDSWPGSML